MTEFDLSDHHEQIFGVALTDEQMFPDYTHCECPEYRCTGLLVNRIRVRRQDLQVERRGLIEDCPLSPTRRWVSRTPILNNLSGGGE